LEEAKASFNEKENVNKKKKKPQIKEDWKALKTWRGHRGCKYNSVITVKSGE
jgi:hypothetical protein